ncbi:hypothetical protein NDU88_003287 [Pleurodeles waltl]|uniref:Uncharacterized protein n=1 Tax=Pleurodeles waltl TaxID=8319 RepID=A0AAV7M440_PLEWA|nr:hypothetical protein NDU88_003287 [Pleurodeles waltl]
MRTVATVFPPPAMERPAARTSEAAPGQQDRAEAREAQNSNSDHALGRAWPAHVRGTSLPGMEGRRSVEREQAASQRVSHKKRTQSSFCFTCRAHVLSQIGVFFRSA